METSKAHALIVAGGTSQRFGGATPKLYHLLDGRPVLWHTLQAFATHPTIGCIVLVHHKDHGPWLAPILAAFPQVECVTGGATRQESVKRGVALVPDDGGKLLIHDAARPFISHAVINRVLSGLQQAAAVYPAIPLVDTIRDNTGALHDRNTLFAAQTPQGFHVPLIRRLHAENQAAVTDDIALAQAAGIAVQQVAGEAMNTKITVQADLKPMAKTAVKIGHGIDVHAFIDHAAGDEQTIKICGISVPCDKAIEGHSDGDVGLHALTDAILGGICGGDIGQLFPSESSEWAGADSALFLREAVKRMRDTGAELAHADITLIAQMPKLSPHREAMRQRVAEICQVEVARISIKATTTDYLGFTGRKEGLAAMAIATLNGS